MPTQILRPIGNINTAWANFDYQQIDDAVIDPTAGDATGLFVDNADDTKTQKWSLPSSLLRTLTRIDFHVNGSRGAVSGGSMTLSLRANGVEIESAAIRLTAITPVFGWDSISKTKSLGNPAGSLELWATSSHGMTDSDTYDVIYVLLTGSLRGSALRGRSPSIKSPIV
jgi:hypothetical protein